MGPFLRRVRTASGATAVQIVARDGRINRVVEHLGSAHDEAGPVSLMAAGRTGLTAPDQQMVEFDAAAVTHPAVVTAAARPYWSVLCRWRGRRWDSIRPVTGPSSSSSWPV